MSFFAYNPWVPIASIVTIASFISISSNKSGIAFISFDLSSTFTCPMDIPTSPINADTIYLLIYI